MNLVDDQEFLKAHQYKSSANLEARIALHRDFGTNPQPWQTWAFEQLELQPGMRVLEIGCGPGHLWLENLARLPAGLQVWLGDFSPGMVQQARHSLDGQDFTYLNLDAQALPFPDGYFDRVIANHMLYHVPNLPRAVGELRRVLRYGGKLCAATNGVGHMRELNELARRFLPPAEQALYISGATQRFSLENALEVLSEGFEMVDVRVFEDDLEVTAVQPILAYIASMSSMSVSPETLALIAGYLDDYFMQHASFHIGKSQGMAVAL